MIHGPHLLGPEGFTFAPHISVGEIWSALRIDGSKVKGDATKAATEAGTVAGRTMGAKWKESFTRANIGKGLVQGLGLGAGLTAVNAVTSAVSAVGDAIVGTIDAARGWETAMTGVKKTLDTTGLSAEEAERAFDDIERGLRDMAQQIPLPVERLAALAEAGGALGIAREDLLEFTKTAALMGTTTDIAAEDAATALGKIGAVMPFTREEYSRFASTLVDLGNKGASTEREIISMAQNMAGAAATVGISKADLLGWASALANVGEEAEAGGSSFQKLALGVNAIANNGGEKLDRLAETVGTTGDAFRSLWNTDSSEALRQLVQGLSRMDKNARQATLAALGFSDIRITRALLSLTGNMDNLNGALTVAPKAWDENTAAVAEAEKRFATFDSKVQLIQNRVHDWAITFGEVLVSGIVLAIDAIESLGDAFHMIERFMSPHLALLEDQDAELKALARQYGVNEEALLAYARAQRQASDEASELAKFTSQVQDALGEMDDAVKNPAVADFIAKLRDLSEVAGVPFRDVLVAASVDIQSFGLSIETMGNFLDEMGDALGVVKDETGGFVTTTDAALAVLTRFLREMSAEGAVNASTRFWQATAQGATDAGQTISGAGGVIGQAVARIREAVVGAVRAATFEFNRLDLKTFRREFGSSVQDIADGFKDMVPGIRSAFQQAKAQVRAGMADLKWAVMNPMRDQEFIQFLGRQITKAQKLMQIAQKNGDREGVRLARQQVRNLRDEQRAMKIHVLRDRMDDAQDALRRKIETGKGPSVAKLRELIDKLNAQIKRLTGFSATFTVVARQRLVAAEGKTGREDAPMLASGGHIERTAWVGERGPELYVADRPGYVLNRQDAMAAAGAGMAGRIDLYVHDPDGGLARAGVSTGSLADEIVSGLMSADRDSGARYHRAAR